MLNQELLNRKILCCPENGTPLAMAEQALVDQVNKQIAAGKLQNAGGSQIETRLDGGLIREDGARLYPIIEGIPVLLIDEAILLDASGDSSAETNA